MRGGRIISACAERSHTLWTDVCGVWDHLRVCGVVDGEYKDDPDMPGSSPRVRSGLAVRGRGGSLAGIISACAERSEW